MEKFFSNIFLPLTTMRYNHPAHNSTCQHSEQCRWEIIGKSRCSHQTPILMTLNWLGALNPTSRSLQVVNFSISELKLLLESGEKTGSRIQGNVYFLPVPDCAYCLESKKATQFSVISLEGYCPSEMLVDQ